MIFRVGYSYTGENEWVYIGLEFGTYQEALDHISSMIKSDEDNDILGTYDYRINCVQIEG